jgi:hypothetical protein
MKSTGRSLTRGEDLDGVSKQLIVHYRDMRTSFSPKRIGIWAVLVGIAVGVASWRLLGPVHTTRLFRQFSEEERNRWGQSAISPDGKFAVMVEHTRASWFIRTTLSRVNMGFAAAGLKVVDRDSGEELMFLMGATAPYFPDDQTLAVSFGDEENTVFLYELPPRVPLAQILGYSVMGTLVAFLVASYFSWCYQRAQVRQRPPQAISVQST